MTQAAQGMPTRRLEASADQRLPMGLDDRHAKHRPELPGICDGNNDNGGNSNPNCETTLNNNNRKRNGD